MQPAVPRYNEEEYASLLRPEPGWSAAETAYLLDLCRRYELRFVAIADRYEVRGAVGWDQLGCELYSGGLGLRSAVRRGQAGAQPRCCTCQPAPTRQRRPALPRPPPFARQFPGAPERSIEDLKARYYAVARQLLVGREGGPESVANNVMVSEGVGARRVHGRLSEQAHAG